MSDASVDTALLDQDTEVLREVFDATGGRDRWILGVADFGARLQPPPPPPDHAPALKARLEDEKEPLGRASSFLFAFLSGLASPQASPHLAQLLLRLNYNRFFLRAAATQ